MFHLPVLQAKMFWQIRATCRKPLITNESGLMLLFVHLKSMIYWRWHTIKGHRASCISPPSPSRNAVYLTMSEPMGLSIVHLIRYWTAAVNNIHNFCKLGFLFTFVGYKIRQVDYCTCVPSLFTHSHAHTHSDANVALADDCSEQDCALKEALQIHFPKTIDVFGFLAWHSHSIEKRLLLGPKQAKLGNVLL